MLRLITILTCATALAPLAYGQSFDPLPGVWRQDDGAATVRIAKCGTGSDLCAVVIAEKLESGEPSRLGKVTVKDIRAVGSRRWTGMFIDQGVSMKARVDQLSSDTVSFKICAFAFLCDKKRFQRIER
jgi:uncharacterized protein (DUF2147 family)